MYLQIGLKWSKRQFFKTDSEFECLVLLFCGSFEPGTGDSYLCENYFIKWTKYPVTVYPIGRPFKTNERPGTSLINY